MLSSNIQALLCQGMCGLLGPSTPVIPLPSDLLFADIPQMLLTSHMVLAKESWAVRGMFLLRRCSSYHKSALQKQQHGRPRRPLGIQIKHLFSQWRDGEVLGRPHCLPGAADLRQLRDNFSLVLGGYILLAKSIREYMVDFGIINLEANMPIFYFFYFFFLFSLTLRLLMN